MKQFHKIDVRILKKYDTAGPRYTSYPPAPVFTSEFDDGRFEVELILNNQPKSSADLSLYFHFPFCDTLCYFCGCTMMVTRDRARVRKYVDVLKREIDLFHRYAAPDRRVAQLHWGGGTPTHLHPEEIRELAEHIGRRFRFTPDAEIAVEIDPRGLTLEHMKALKDSGFNRVSMGVQDFNPRVQHAVNRIQPEEITNKAIEWCRALGFSSINIDLIYGLPLQNVESFEQTINQIIGIAPDRLAVFNYAHVPWLKPHQKLIHPEDLPSPQTRLEILKMSIEKLTDAGYWYIGMDHFAKPEDELAVAQRNRTLYRNFQGYSTKAGCDLYGLGMSSISHFANVYAQNLKKLPEYYSAIEAGAFATHVGYKMTRDDEVRKHVIMRLMCDPEVSKSDVERRFGIVFDEYFRDALEQLRIFVDDGLVSVSSGLLKIERMGRLVLRNVAMCFDAHLPRMQKEKQIFSRTV
ncbi:MAG: oxygen-independent coproporphyrinogen III oxidase [Bacteroidota bacterium]